MVIKNCVFWQNVGSQEIRNYKLELAISYSDIDDGGISGGGVGPTNAVNADGNINSDPQFAGTVDSGDWSAQGSYDPLTGQTKLTDTGAGWTDNEFAEMFVMPDLLESVATNMYFQYPVVSNDSDEIWVWGNTLRYITTPTNGAPYTINDYHVKSIGARYTPLAWVTDTVNSPCIDAGDPTSSYDGEPQPHGWRVNMGAYGNTAQASKSQPKRSLFLIQ